MVEAAGTILSLINRIYSAAEDPEMWPGVLQSLCSRFSASKSVVICYDFVDRRGSRILDSNPDPYFAEMTTRYASKNPWLRHDEMYRPGNVFLGDEVVAPADLLATEFYQEFLLPQDCFHRLCGVITRAGNKTTFLAVHRPRASAPFTESDERRMQVLLPHLQGSLRLQFEILQYRDRGQLLLDLIDRLPIAVLLVGPDGRIASANRQAEEILAERDGLHGVGRWLCTADRVEQAELRRLIACTASFRLDTIGDAGGDLAISRPSGRRSLMVAVIPLGHAIGNSFATPDGLAAVIVRDPEAETQSGPHRFAAMYHLTPAEERLFALIARGMSLQEAREHLGVSKNTARSHMKRIYLKTETHRQADLVRLYFSARLDRQ
jgi:DNA-binding CsgD family transcriptional regulator